jgi:hypothetical protein
VNTLVPSTNSRIWAGGIAADIGSTRPIAIQSFSFYVPAGSNTWFAQLALSQSPTGNSSYTIGPVYYLP